VFFFPNCEERDVRFRSWKREAHDKKMFRYTKEREGAPT
jgi:hypothetical protein